MSATTPRAVGLLLLTVMIPMSAGPAAAYIGQELAGDARITIDQARAIALKAHPGRITDEELEREDGGSGLRYTCSRTVPTEKSSISRSRPPRRERRFPYQWSNHVRRRKNRIEQGS
jgi:hypothetical protein